MFWRRPVSFVNARVAAAGGLATTIRFGTKILDVGGPPARGDFVVDVEGAWVLPGLINAHDHLELNHYGTQTGRAPYGNVREWVNDMRPRLESDPVLKAGRQRPLAARLFAGGFKNLLAGVTLVAHHNPLYRGIRRASPAPVLRRFGWAHSLGMQDAPVGSGGERGGSVLARHAETVPGRPFVVHAAEGLDAEAEAEIDALDEAGVLTTRTVLVHVLAVNGERRRQLLDRGVGIVWCPASNLALFNRTWTDVPVASGLVAIGTDSRLTGARDLLDELQVAAEAANVGAEALLPMVTSAPARVLQCARGALQPGRAADLILLPSRDGGPGGALAGCRRADLQLVVTEGRPRVGARHLAGVFAARGVRTAACEIDRRHKVIDRTLLREYVRYGIEEPGVRVPVATA
jgi:cytosine/adenosine deaminase-related metal-dependent hydrolase